MQNLEAMETDKMERKEKGIVLDIVKKAYFDCYGKSISTIKSRDVKISELSQAYLLGLLESVSA